MVFPSSRAKSVRLSGCHDGPMMSAVDVLNVLEALSSRNIVVWLDGGWGVDALLGTQTREHDDVDLVLNRSDLGVVLALLEAQGFATERDWLPTAIALRHADARAVDLHPVDPTEDGGGDQVLGEGSYHYGPPVTGMIEGRRVPCCSVETQVEIHQGYEPDANDRADMAHLTKRFGVSWSE
jgi:lincosamide nucleotidyltransferase A/C/D/E